MADEKQGPHPNTAPPEYGVISPQTTGVAGTPHPAGMLPSELPTPTPAPVASGYPQPQPQQQQRQPIYAAGQHIQYGVQPQYYIQQPGMPGQPIMVQPGQIPMAQQQQPGVVYSGVGHPGLIHPSTIPGATPMLATDANGQTQVVYQVPKAPTMTVSSVQGAPVTTTQSGIKNPNNFQTAMPLGALGLSPAPIDCPNCHTRNVTNITHVAGASTHLWALGFCFFLLMPCIPYLIDSFKDVQHRCSSCGVVVATSKRGGGTQVHVFS